MVSSSKRARRRRLAQWENSHSDHQMDPANLSGPDSDREEGEDHEILFPPRTQDIVITPSSPGKVQAVLDCDIANMVKTLWRYRRRVPRHCPDTTGVPTVVHRKHNERQSSSCSDHYGEGVWLVTGGYTTIWPTDTSRKTSSGDAGGCSGCRWKFTRC